MTYPGYSKDEYISEVVFLLKDRFGLDPREASDLVWDESDIRHYSHGPRSPSPSALANRIGREQRLRPIEKKGPPMEPGYAYKYVGRGEWEDVIVSEDVTENAKFEGFATIYGNRMAVWKSGRHSYAQTAVGSRHESHWR